MTAPSPIAYRGVEYPSRAALARHLGFSPQYVFYALRRGTVDDLEPRSPDRSKHGRSVVVDGERYPNVSLAALALGVSYTTLYAALTASASDRVTSRVRWADGSARVSCTEMHKRG